MAVTLKSNNNGSLGNVVCICVSVMCYAEVWSFEKYRIQIRHRGKVILNARVCTWWQLQNFQMVIIILEKIIIAPYGGSSNPILAVVSQISKSNCVILKVNSCQVLGTVPHSPYASWNSRALAQARAAEKHIFFCGEDCSSEHQYKCHHLKMPSGDPFFFFCSII